MRKKTKNRHGGYGLQVLLLMLVMLVGGTTNIQAQSYITDVIVLGCGISGLDAKCGQVSAPSLLTMPTTTQTGGRCRASR